MLLPAILIITILAMTFSYLKAKKKLSFILTITALSIFLYLNLLSVIYFIGSSYNLIFLIALNIGAISLFLYAIFKKWKEKVIYGLNLVLIISLVFISFNWINYGHYNLTIQQNGLHLYVETQEIDYVIPETIGGIKVIEVDFPFQNDFNVESLTIGRYVEKLHIISAIVLDDLKYVYVDQHNLHFYVDNNIIYDYDGSVIMVPIHTESLYLNDEVIITGPFRDLIYLKSLQFGPNVKLIKHDAFENARSLVTLTFDQQSQIEMIEDYAFKNAINLKVVDLPISLQHLGIGVFYGASNLESLRAPFIGPERETSDYLYRSHDILVYFFGSKTYLQSSLIPESLKTVEFYDIEMIHHTTFYNALHIENIILPTSMDGIGIRSFYGTLGLSSFTIPSGVESIPESSFENSGIKTIIIPSSVKFIDLNAFKNTTIQEVIYLGDINDLVINPIGKEVIINLLLGE